MQAAKHLDLNKKLISDIAKIKKLTTATTCVDATNCCSRVARPFATFCAHYFGLDVTCLLFIFKTMHVMKLCLRTTFGMSDRFCTGE